MTAVSPPSTRVPPRRLAVRRYRGRLSCRPQLEVLEGREVPAIIITPAFSSNGFNAAEGGSLAFRDTTASGASSFSAFDTADPSGSAPGYTARLTTAVQTTAGDPVFGAGTIDVDEVAATGALYNLTVTGDNSADVTLTGRLSDINAFLASEIFLYRPGDFSGNALVGFTVSTPPDSLTPDTNGGSVAVAVTPVTDPPGLAVSVPDRVLANVLNPLMITAAEVDIDGSETITSVTVFGVHNGGSFSDGAYLGNAAGNPVGTDNGAGGWVLSPGELAGLRYFTYYSGSVTLDVTAQATDTDGMEFTSGPASTTRSVTFEVQYPPAVAPPFDQTFRENSVGNPLAGFSGGDRFSLFDGDADPNEAYTANIVATHGRIGFSPGETPPAGLLYQTDNDLRQLLIQGTYSQVSSFLSSLTLYYTPDAGFAGADTLTLTASDADGNVGVGTADITVSSPVVDAPNGTDWTRGIWSPYHGENSANSPYLQFSDPGGLPTDTYTLDLFATAEVAGDTAQLTFEYADRSAAVTVTGEGTNHAVITGTLAALNQFMVNTGIYDDGVNPPSAYDPGLAALNSAVTQRSPGWFRGHARINVTLTNDRDNTVGTDVIDDFYNPIAAYSYDENGPLGIPVSASVPGGLAGDRIPVSIESAFVADPTGRLRVTTYEVRGSYGATFYDAAGNAVGAYTPSEAGDVWRFTAAEVVGLTAVLAYGGRQDWSVYGYTYDSGPGRNPGDPDLTDGPTTTSVDVSFVVRDIPRVSIDPIHLVIQGTSALGNTPGAVDLLPSFYDSEYDYESTAPYTLIITAAEGTVSYNEAVAAYNGVVADPASTNRRLILHGSYFGLRDAVDGYAGEGYLGPLITYSPPLSTTRFGFAVPITFEVISPPSDGFPDGRTGTTSTIVDVISPHDTVVDEGGTFPIDVSSGGVTHGYNPYGSGEYYFEPITITIKGVPSTMVLSGGTLDPETGDYVFDDPDQLVGLKIFSPQDTGGQPVKLTLVAKYNSSESGPSSFSTFDTSGPSITPPDLTAATEFEFLLTVLNVAPKLTGQSVNDVTVGDTTVFDLGSFADPGIEGTWKVTVDFGDGTVETRTVTGPGALGGAAHVYAAAGNYTVRLRVFDGTATSEVALLAAVAAVPTTPTTPTPTVIVPPDDTDPIFPTQPLPTVFVNEGGGGVDGDNETGDPDGTEIGEGEGAAFGFIPGNGEGDQQSNLPATGVSPFNTPLVGSLFTTNPPPGQTTNQEKGKYPLPALRSLDQTLVGAGFDDFGGDSFPLAEGFFLDQLTGGSPAPVDVAPVNAPAAPPAGPSTAVPVRDVGPTASATPADADETDEDAGETEVSFGRWWPAAVAAALPLVAATVAGASAGPAAPPRRRPARRTPNRPTDRED